MDIEYIKRLEDPNDMSTMLKEAISARLAAELSLPITGSAERQGAMWELYKNKMDIARHTRSAQRSDDSFTTNTWNDSRLEGSYRPISS